MQYKYIYQVNEETKFWCWVSLLHSKYIQTSLNRNIYYACFDEFQWICWILFGYWLLFYYTTMVSQPFSAILTFNFNFDCGAVSINQPVWLPAYQSMRLIISIQILQYFGASTSRPRLHLCNERCAMRDIHRAKQCDTWHPRNLLAPGQQ